MGSLDEYAQFQELVGSDPVARQALEILRREKSANGWSIAKMLDQDPQKVGEALNKLRRGGLIDSESGSGLDGFYFLTRLTYRLTSVAS